MKTLTALIAMTVVALFAARAHADETGQVESAGRAKTQKEAEAACRNAGGKGGAMGLPTADEYFSVIAGEDRRFARGKEAKIELKIGGQASSIYPIWTEEGLVTMQDGTGMDMSRVDPESLSAGIEQVTSAIEQGEATATTDEEKANVAEGRANVEAMKKALEKGFPVYCVARAGS